MTSKLHRDDREFLHDMLASLVKRFGNEELLLAISEIQEIPFDRLGRRQSAEKGRVIPRERARSSERPSAVLIAQRADVPPTKKTLLVNLALQFDHKAFLPTLPDIRHFLEMRGKNLGSIKQRSDAFRKVIAAVVGMPEDALERLLANSLHSGPSQLGPLSDAIKAVGASSRSERNNPGLFAYESGAHIQSDALPAPVETASDVSKSVQSDETASKPATRDQTVAGVGEEKDQSSQPTASDPTNDAVPDISVTPLGYNATVSASAFDDESVAAEFVKETKSQPSVQNKRPHNRYEASRSQKRNPPKRSR